MKTKLLLLTIFLLSGIKSFAQSCDCLIPVDTSFDAVPFTGYAAPDYRNDDASSAAIALPFSFCFYGESYDTIFINNNGNISFDNVYSTYSASGFPSASFLMIAPFWADVDTRNIASGIVSYKITPTALIVRWNRVGYFNSQAEKKNDFQLIITDGNSSDLPAGYNVQFCYGDMQWTTGSASGGTNGFGGTPATAGINRGNGSNFWQLGRFDEVGNSYDGPVADGDGISWLDNKSFNTNTCYTPDTVDPLVVSANMCDTITVPLYASKEFEFFTLPQFTNYDLTLIVDTTNIRGFNYTVNTVTGNNTYGIVEGTFTASPARTGINEIKITALYVDPQNIANLFAKQYRYYFYVENCPVSVDSFSISGYSISGIDTVICANFSTYLHATGNYQFVWLNDNSTGTTFYIPPVIETDTIITIRVQAIDTNTNCNTVKTINLYANICAGLNDISAANIKLFPNPATDNLQWSIAQGTDIKDGLIQVFNTTGQLVYNKNITSVNENIQLTGLAQGSYYLKTTLQSGIKVIPFVKIDK